MIKVGSKKFKKLNLVNPYQSIVIVLLFGVHALCKPMQYIYVYMYISVTDMIANCYKIRVCNT